MAPLGREDPAPKFKFHVELGSNIEASFTECSGLSLEREVETYAEGGRNDHELKLPGRTKYQNIVLKFGVTHSKALWKWYQAGLYDVRVDRRNISILLFNVKGETVRRWNIVDAYPVKWTGSDLNAANSEVAFETIEFTHHGIRLS